MNNLFNLTPFSQNLTEEQANELIEQYHLSPVTFAPHEFLQRQGDPLTSIGCVLKGVALIESLSPAGDRQLISFLQRNDIWGLGQMAAQDQWCSFSVIAQQQTQALFLPTHLFTDPHSQAAQKLTLTAFHLLGKKNKILTQRLGQLTPKTLRGKILEMLHQFASPQGQVDLPFDRQSMADYLCADRSALSRELHRMTQDQLISLNGRHIIILHQLKKQH